MRNLPRTPAAIRALRRVSLEPSGCWRFLGCCNEHGYGVVGADGKRGQKVLTHRAVFEFFVGPIPQGLHVLHSCDNPPCCNPSHLRAGTHADNMRDKAERGRVVVPSKFKTHCVHGHPLSGDNIFVTRQGYRKCRECCRDRARERRQSRLSPAALAHAGSVTEVPGGFVAACACGWGPNHYQARRDARIAQGIHQTRATARAERAA